MQPPFSRRVRVVHDCVESNVHVSEINQRDELVFDAGGVRITRVVWNVLVNFNTTTRSRRQRPRRSTLDARRSTPAPLSRSDAGPAAPRSRRAQRVRGQPAVMQVPRA
jgi:hypothetical protein